MENLIQIDGKSRIFGIEVPNIYGGFGKGGKQYKARYGIEPSDLNRDYMKSWQVESFKKLQEFDLALISVYPSDREQRRELLQKYFDANYLHYKINNGEGFFGEIE